MAASRMPGRTPAASASLPGATAVTTIACPLPSGTMSKRSAPRASRVASSNLVGVRQRGRMGPTSAGLAPGGVAKLGLRVCALNPKLSMRQLCGVRPRATPGRGRAVCTSWSLAAAQGVHKVQGKWAGAGAGACGPAPVPPCWYHPACTALPVSRSSLAASLQTPLRRRKPCTANTTRWVFEPYFQT
jgi:hypothetical protein